MPGTLYIVATPIGNLEDITLRAVRILGECDFVACEDTRVSVKLMNRLGLKKPLVSYYKQKERAQSAYIVERLLGGESTALVTDAGTPCISDPGALLIDACREAGIAVVPVPGPSAVIAALSASGFGGRFCFEGFLSTATKSRREHLASLVAETRTIVFYEAPHKLPHTLADLLSALGDRRLVLARELTKLHEEIVDTTLAQALAACSDTPPRGEYVLVIAGADPAPVVDNIPFDEAVARIRALIADGASTTEAVKFVAKETGHNRNELYRAVADG